MMEKSNKIIDFPLINLKHKLLFISPLLQGNPLYILLLLPINLFGFREYTRHLKNQNQKSFWPYHILLNMCTLMGQMK